MDATQLKSILIKRLSIEIIRYILTKIASPLTVN
jgi:hypothetical protein